MNRVETKAVFELVLFRENQHHDPAEFKNSRPLEINVLCTSVLATGKAIESAVKLARGLNATLRLLVAQVVPFAVPLETPPVLVEFQEALFRDIARNYGIETRVDIYLCRDAHETFACQLKPRSVVVLGARKRWWRTSEDKLARRLRRAGHEVVVVYGNKENTHA